MVEVLFLSFFFFFFYLRPVTPTNCPQPDRGLQIGAQRGARVTRKPGEFSTRTTWPKNYVIAMLRKTSWRVDQTLSREQQQRIYAFRFGVFLKSE